MNEDNFKLLDNLSDMLKDKEVPDNLQELLNSFINKPQSQASSSNDDSSSKNENNIDMDTFLKMKKIFDTMNSKSNNESANLLLSLKPYLKDNKKEKVDQYVKLLNMSKLIDVFNPLGGDKKNNV